MKATAPQPIVFAVPGDLHLTCAGRINHQAALQAIDEINRLVKPDFVQFIGDNVEHAAREEFNLFKELAARVESPWLALVGDHDIHGDPQAHGFREDIGPTYGSISIRGFRFVRLNTQEAKPVGISPEQIEWLRLEVASAQRNGEAIVVFQHNYPYQIWEEFAGPGIDDWRIIVQSARVSAIFCGHTHYHQIANDGRNICVATRSIGDPEGGPPGYLLAYLHGEDLAVAYRSIDERGPIVLITHPRETLLATRPSHVVRDRAIVRARIWSEQPVAEVRAKFDERPWIDLQQSGAQDWWTELSVERLGKGEHRLTVECRDAVGRPAQQTIQFPVDATGRFIAVPTVRPPVSATKYC